ncbi:hypothetical protein, conserved [Cyanidioschyzon merolae strain 10D]|uniref:DUF1995 domain-containing protein n=1 Tax=Cyanidioschyzon merolae (strain NIES-3377 / 10D) TaxID=280699 RepID=M1VKG6_CYAM1|nr:hypothetical protein, conserved [Cyanidioschyzon merolae strain 10D]BAM81988.1 hypothetical protein, conserved [Cyanidioschyzon merolae strain 10D]|eukprot:XP_005538024.1 hypothetical protein, conserved [Cyanidioschyzon merolae strain 10D]
MFLVCQYTSLPKDTASLHRQVQNALSKATETKTRSPALYEVSFPAVRDTTAALSRILDANTSHAREIIKPFAASFRKRLHLVFPDVAEAKIAEKVYGSSEHTFTLSALPLYERPAFLQQVEAPALVFVVQPGFNIDEWLQLERPALLYPDASIVVLNGNMDRLRSNYYPPLFYPRLTALRKRYLEQFEPIYYLKPLPNGLLFRVFPEPWQTFFCASPGEATRIAVDDERPTFPQTTQRLMELSREQR